MTAPFALTSGDPSGVGPEISLKAWSKRTDLEPFFLIADQDFMWSIGTKLGVSVAPISAPEEAAEAFQTGLPVLHHPLTETAVPGQPSPANASAIVSAIERAVTLVQAGKASAFVTNPINKKGLRDGADFAFPGHTEFLAALAGVPRPVMMLAAPELRVIPVTIHIPLASVPGLLTANTICDTIRIAHHALRQDFGLQAPRVAVAGLNPHAGEGGMLGVEDEAIIVPALTTLRGEGMDITGPLPADTMFHAAARDRYDVAVCMYHDQALIPLKTLNFSAGVNVTLGLPFVRTSPDHGTAYDIAGKNEADPTSLIEALRMAGQMVQHRERA